MQSIDRASKTKIPRQKPMSYEKQWNVVDIKRALRRLEKEAGDADWTGDAPLADELRKKIASYKLMLALGTTHDADF